MLSLKKLTPRNAVSTKDFLHSTKFFDHFKIYICNQNFKIGRNIFVSLINSHSNPVLTYFLMGNVIRAPSVKNSSENPYTYPYPYPFENKKQTGKLRKMDRLTKVRVMGEFYYVSGIFNCRLGFMNFP